MTTHLYLF